MLLTIQESNLSLIPHDMATDCMDLFELVTGARGLSSDKNQRLVVVSLREDRLQSRIRSFQHYPTTCMLADALTKPGLFLQMLHFCTTGFMKIEPGERFIRQRVSQRQRAKL